MNPKTPEISTRTLVEQAVDLIEELITKGEIKAGTRLREQELEKMIGISRTPIREALLCLESRGLVESTPRRGTYVKTINADDLADNLEIWLALEGVAVRLAHQRIDADGLDTLREILKRMKTALKENDSEAFVQEHENYHTTLIAIAQNKWLERELSVVRKITCWYRFHFQFELENYKQSLAGHEKQFRLLSDPEADEEVLVNADNDIARKEGKLLLKHIRKLEAERDASEIAH